MTARTMVRSCSRRGFGSDLAAPTMRIASTGGLLGDHRFGQRLRQVANDVAAVGVRVLVGVGVEYPSTARTPQGKLQTQFRTGTSGNTSASRCTAVSLMRLPRHALQKPRRLHESWESRHVAAMAFQQQAYDPRLRDSITRTGDLKLAARYGVPRGTARCSGSVFPVHSC